MRIFLLAILLAGLVLLGCFGPQAPPAPDYTPPVVEPAPAPVVHKPVPAVNNTTAIPPIGINNTPALPPKVNATTPIKPVVPSNATNHTAPANASTNATIPVQPPTSVCSGGIATDSLDCISQAAIAAKDVRMCAQLVSAPDRAQCLTLWCHSSARSLNACSGLAVLNDRLSCIQKCSPNFNG